MKIQKRKGSAEFSRLNAWETERGRGGELVSFPSKATPLKQVPSEAGPEGPKGCV